MKKFKLYGFNNNKPIVITNTAEALSPASTFDETLSIQENKRASLTFSIYKKITVNALEIIENPFLNILHQNAKLRYEDMETNSVIDFIITNISYTISKENVKYTIKAEDYASQILAKRGQDMEIDITGNIEEVVTEIFRLSNKLAANTKSANQWRDGDWRIDPNLKATDFLSPIDETKPKKITLILSNTNMYNALIETALLFNANIDFDYKKKYIKFVNKVTEKFNGFRLRPDVNLSSITVGDSNTNFTTAMHIVGGELEDDSGTKYTLYPIPDMPLEVKSYFAECVDKDFVNTTYFSTYDSNNTYISKLDKIMEYKLKNDNTAERRAIVKEYLELCDLFPHLENTLFDIYYFYSIGAISKKKLDNFNNVLNNEIRKYNIKIKLHSERYYSSYVNYSILKTEIDNNIEFLAAEEMYKQQLLDEGAKTTDSSVVDSVLKIDAYKAKINNLVRGEDFINAVLNIYGKTSSTTGFDKLITDCETQINNYKTQYNVYNTRLADIETKLKGIADPSSVQYIMLNTEKAGVIQLKENIIKLVGTSVDSTCGTVGTLGHWKSFLTIAKSAIPSSYGTIKSAYDLVINQDSPDNLVVQKKQILGQLYKDYDIFIIETTYTNTDELSSYNLAEQAFLTFYGGVVPNTEVLKKKYYKRMLGYNTPTRSFNLSFIDLSTLEEFSYLDMKVGDTVEINEPALNILREKVRITSISYNLRDAAQTKLGVALITEEQDILQKLLLNLSK